MRRSRAVWRPAARYARSRWSCLVLVNLQGIKSEQVVAALRQQVVTLPEQLRRSLTWDQGKEMARHVQFTIETGVAVYLCHPKSPWQRGTNESTNGLIRQKPPKRTTYDLTPEMTSLPSGSG